MQRMPNQQPFEAAERFFSKTEKRGDCYIWTAAATNGQGNFYFNGAGILAPRFAYILEHGFIPHWHSVVTLCGNLLCVNHEHLGIKERIANNKGGKK